MFTPLPSTKSNVSSGQGKGLVLSPNVSPVSGASASTLPSSYTLCGNQDRTPVRRSSPDVRTWLTTWKSRLPCAKGSSLDSASIENQWRSTRQMAIGRGVHVCHGAVSCLIQRKLAQNQDRPRHLMHTKRSLVSVRVLSRASWARPVGKERNPKLLVGVKEGLHGTARA
mgnify:CR=1 FL=1